jgi:hypothetical protein
VAVTRPRDRSHIMMTIRGPTFRAGVDTLQDPRTERRYRTTAPQAIESGQIGLSVLLRRCVPTSAVSDGRWRALTQRHGHDGQARELHPSQLFCPCRLSRARRVEIARRLAVARGNRIR